MLKRLFLNYKTRKLKTAGEHVSYAVASQIGLLYNRDEYTSAQISTLKELLERDGKSVAVLGYESKPSEDPLFFNRKDISITGEIKKNTVDFFVKQPLDFLLSMNRNPNLNYRYILAMSKAACKIGFETEYYSDLLQMSLQMESSGPKAVEDMVKYLKMIS